MARSAIDAPAGALGPGLVRALRPTQWSKNVLVFAAPGAAGVLDEGAVLAEALLAFACFCLAASGGYLLNDAADRDADARHPTKRFRPVASGAVPVGAAIGLGLALIGAGVALGFLARWPLAVAVGAYASATLAYTLWLKHVAVVDVVVVASGFVLRAVAGAAATDVPISDWFFIVASFGSLFMVAGKRSAEFAEMGSEAGTTRASLRAYTDSYLSYLRSVSTGVVLVAYCLWAFERADLTDVSVPWYQISILPFVLGVLRYGLILDRGEGGAPEDVVFGDRALQAIGLLWIVVFGLGVYVDV